MVVNKVTAFEVIVTVEIIISPLTVVCNVAEFKVPVNSKFDPDSGTVALALRSTVSG